MIWAFGDSFTWGHGCRPGWGFTHTDYPIPEYYLKYKKEGDKIWIEWLGEWFDEEIRNISQSGASNDKIFDWVLENFDQIKENDKVIIGMTSWGRMDVPIDDTWMSMVQVMKKQITEHITDQDFWEAVINYQFFFSQSPLWEHRWNYRFNFIINQLNKKKCKTFLFQIQDSLAMSIQTIRQETGISDDHFSFAGHKKFAQIILNKFSTPLI